MLGAWTGSAAVAADNMRPAASMVIAGLAPDILGTSAVPISAGRFSDSIQRARADATRLPALVHLVQPARNLPPLQQLAFVQRAVTSAIQWGSDATEWGQHDYWASAAQTLARGAGDMEDRAIVKLQALRALGFSNSDLFLTLATDRVGGPLTVLIVRIDGHYYVLDDTGGTPFLVDQRKFEFRPVISFGYYGTWVHAPPIATAAAAATAPRALHAHH
jgi:predicted transglutaminase-like cysteine proteinase